MTRLWFWLHSWTRDALMVSIHEARYLADREHYWLPISQVREIGRRNIEHPDGPNRGKGAPLHLGTVIELEIPDWLIEARGIEKGIEI